MHERDTGLGRVLSLVDCDVLELDITFQIGTKECLEWKIENGRVPDARHRNGSDAFPWARWIHVAEHPRQPVTDRLKLVGCDIASQYISVVCDVFCGSAIRGVVTEFNRSQFLSAGFGVIEFNPVGHGMELVADEALPEDPDSIKSISLRNIVVSQVEHDGVGGRAGLAGGKGTQYRVDVSVGFSILNEQEIHIIIGRLFPIRRAADFERPSRNRQVRRFNVVILSRICRILRLGHRDRNDHVRRLLGCRLEEGLLVVRLPLRDVRLFTHDVLHVVERKNRLGRR